MVEIRITFVLVVYMVLVVHKEDGAEVRVSIAIHGAKDKLVSVWRRVRMELVGEMWDSRVLGVRLESVVPEMGGVGMARIIAVLRMGAFRVGLISRFWVFAQSHETGGEVDWSEECL